MKNLKTYIAEAIKPPRLSAKNKELWANNKPLDEKEVMEWIIGNCYMHGKFKIVRGKINVDGDIKITNKDIEYFPYSFGKVKRFFTCYGCKNLKSLKNAPYEVGGYFDCGECTSLTSLEGAPERVGEDFSCVGCDNLTSLEGAPKEVGKDFYCHDCGKHFTEDDIRKVCDVKGKIL